MEKTNKQINQEEERNLNPLGKDEMNSVIKSFQESSFNSEQFYQNEKKMFVKKSLYELAIDSEKNDNEQTNYGKNDITDKTNENQNIENSIKLDETQNSIDDNLEKSILKETSNSDKDQLVNDEPITDAQNNEQDNQESKDIEKQEILNSKDSYENSSASEDKNIENVEKNISTDNDKTINEEIEQKQKFEEETLDAMDSVREAVVKSLEKNEEKPSGQSLDIQNDYEQLIELFENIKNVSINEIEKNIKNKVYELSSEIAGYQIDKVPEKFFQKIKKVLTELNNIKDEITINLNENDFNILKKIDEKDLFSKEIKFQKNSDLNRGEFSISAGGLLHSVMYSKDNKF
tara:strand:- start:1752 stop:2792 length:1041 start_codon:yes stop_codon:yes gene_type:complete